LGQVAGTSTPWTKFCGAREKKTKLLSSGSTGGEQWEPETAKPDHKPDVSFMKSKGAGRQRAFDNAATRGVVIIAEKREVAPTPPPLGSRLQRGG